MRTILGYFVIYLSIICGSICISRIFRKKIESCIVIDIFIKMILLYIFGLIDNLLIGTMVINIVPIVLGVITIIKNRKEKDLKKSIMTSGMLFFTIIYFVFIIFTYYKVTNEWDQYSYWSVATKKMFYSDKMLNPGILLIYPPFPTLLQYYFAKTINIYNQGIEIFANYILGFSLLLPLFEKNNSGKKITNICLGVIIICIPAIFNNILFYQVIYVDAILGLLIGYILYQAYNESNKKFLYFSLILAFLILSLTKATGFYIAVILLFSYLLVILFQILKKRKQIKILDNIKKNKKVLIALVSILIFTTLTFTIWNIYAKDYKIEEDKIAEQYEQISKDTLSIKGAIKTIVTTLFGDTIDASLDRSVSNREFFNVFYEKYALNQPVPITLIGFFIIYVITIAILYKRFIKEENKVKFIKMQAIIVISFVLYSLSLQVAYLTQFSLKEAVNHASFERYINSFFLGITVLLISIILDKFEENNKNMKFKYLILTLAILIITPLNVISEATITSGITNVMKRNALLEVSSQAEMIKEKLNKEDKIYVVNQESDQTPSLWQLKYFLIPEIEIEKTIKINTEVVETFTEQGFIEEWKNILSTDYDYVYIYATDEYFNSLTKELFEEEIKEKTIYKVQKENGKVKLVEY